MKKVISLIMALVMWMGSLPFVVTPAYAATPKVEYSAHVSNIGWMSTVCDGETGGTTGRNLQMEAVKIKLSGVSGGITYRAHVSEIGWQSWVTDNKVAGTTGRNLQMEALQIKLTGDAAKNYDLYYRVHMENIGWGSWTSNGATAGTVGENRQIEAIEVMVLDKGESPYELKMEAFITDSRWEHKASYGNSQKPKCSEVTWSCKGCAAYCADFVYQVFGKTTVYDGTKFTKASEIKSGDVLKVTGSQHWIVVLERDGDKLYTAEGNWTVGGKAGVVRITDSIYTINSNGQLCSGGKVFRTFSCGYHFE